MANLAKLLLERMRMVKEDAIAVAHVVESAFKGADEVDDAILDKDLRQVFYDLQDEKVLDIRRVETREDGQQKRHYLWRIREDVVEAAEARAAPDPVEKIYQRLGEDAWERRRGLELKD